MGCNCGKKKVVNNLGIPSYIQLAIDVWEKVKNIPPDSITEDLWDELLFVYDKIYPNASRQPERTDLLRTIETATKYKKTVKIKR